MTTLRIFKYPLRIDDHQELHMPYGARPLTVQMQGDQPCLWALVNVSSPKVWRTVWCRGTGHPAEGCRPEDYIGTVQLSEGSLTFHFFLLP